MKHFLLLTTLLLTACQPADASLLWIEAEDAVRTGMSTDGPFSPENDTEANMLSGGKWLNAENYAETLADAYAEYEIDIPSDGTFKLITRRFWQHGPFRWRFDEGEWHEVAKDPGALQSQQMQKFIALNWINAGSAELTAGKHCLRIEMLPEREGLHYQTAYGFDCFVLTPDFFVPNGKYRPDQPIGLVDDGLWGFETSTDPFTDSPLDLRYLNEKTAGENGYVTRKGDKFYLADGTETRFWMINFHNVHLDLEGQRYIARQYAKSGVNMVRLFKTIFVSDKLETTDINHLDEELQDGFYKTVAAFREQGIYVKICTYYSLGARIRHEWGLEGFKSHTESWYKPFALLFFNEKLKAAYKERNRKLFTTVNPYTGLTLAEDPAVAIIMTQNEDGLFWGSFDGRNFVAREQWVNVCEQFGDFLTEKYGSLEKAIATWDIPKELNDKMFVRQKGKPSEWIFDDPENGRMHVASGQTIAASFNVNAKVGQLSFPPKERKANAALIDQLTEGVSMRLADTTEFLMKVQRDFNEEMIAFYKSDIGSKALITSDNWRGAWGQSMTDRERYTYLSDDAISRNIYQSPFHKNPKNEQIASWQINVGDSYQDYTALERPWFLPLNYKSFSDKPFMITECNWSSPNFKQLEGPWLISVFGARNGLDGFTWFNVFVPGYDVAPRKFPVATPNVLGQFPATALLYRKGYVKEAPSMAHETRTFDDLRGHVQPALGESVGYDPTRDAGLDTTIKEDIYGQHPFAFLAAPVTWNVTDETSVDIDSKLGTLIDMDAKEVRGALGQTTINWEKKLATVDTPKAQGAVGAIGTQKFSDCTVTIENDFASVLIVPLDDLPLAESKKMLVQIGVHARPYGWREEPNDLQINVRGKREKQTIACKKITSLGEGMYNLPMINGTVVFKNPVTGAVALDANGYPKADAKPVIEGNTLTLPANALYTIVTR